MPPYAVSVTMSTLVKGIDEQFSNVFHFDVDVPFDTESGWESLGDQVVAAIRPLFSNRVNFRRYRIHGRTDTTKAEDQMRFVKDLTGTGTLSVNFDIAPELAVVADVYVGRGPKGGKQFLRKFIHSCGLNSSGSSDAAQGRTAIPSAGRTVFVNALNSLKVVSVAGFDHPVCTPNGKRLPLGSTWEVNPYVATRQFRRGKKERPAA